MDTILLTIAEIAGGQKMRYINLQKTFWLITVVLVLLLSQTPVQGATNCLMASGAPDRDCDGFSDAEEASPIAGVQTDPAKADLFVILAPTSTGTSLLQDNPLGTLIASAAPIGLYVHQIAGPISGIRNVTATQKAIKVQESLYVGAYLGVSPQGNPDMVDDTGASVVYTQKIKSTVAGLCTTSKGVALVCNDADGSTIGQQAVINKYIKHTVAHEASHQLNLKYTCDSTIGCHYTTITSGSQSPTIMDQSVFYVKGTKGVAWYIGSKYNAADANLQLR